MHTATPSRPNPRPPRRVLGRRWLVNLALLLAIGVLASIALLGPGREPTTAGPALTALDPDDITRVRVERPRDTAVVLERQNDGWRLSAPIAGRANRFVIKRLLALATAPSERAITVSTEALAEYGLDAPQARVWLNDAEIAIGAMHPLKNQGYVRHRDAVHLVAGHLLSAVSGRYSDYLDTRLFEGNRTPIAIKLPELSVIRKDGVWERQPPDMDLTSDRINDFVEEWRHASALTVVKYSGKPVLDRIEIRFADGERGETLPLGVLAYQPEFIVYREDEGLEYHLPEETGKRLLTLAANR